MDVAMFADDVLGSAIMDLPIVDSTINHCFQRPLVDYDYQKVQNSYNACIKAQNVQEIEQLLKRCLKQVPGASNNQGCQVVVDVQDANITAATALAAIFRAIPMMHKPDTTVLPIFEMLLASGHFKKANEMGVVLAQMAQSLSTVDAILGDIQQGVILDSYEAKSLLNARTQKKVTVITTPALLTKLLQSSFQFTSTNKEMGTGELLTHDQVVPGLAVGVDVACGDASLSFSIHKGAVMVSGKIEEFFSAWNANMVKDTVVYKEVSRDEELRFNIVLAMYDYTYDNKVWKAVRASHVLGVHYSKLGVPLKTFDTFASKVAEIMSRYPKFKHYMDQYNVYLIACKETWEKFTISDELFKQIETANRFQANEFKTRGVAVFKQVIAAAPTDALKMALKVRALRKQFRNQGFREVITKGMFDIALPFAPAPILTARKFYDIMLKNLAVYQADADVFGCAQMHFFSVLEWDSLLSKPGKRTYYDNDVNYVGTHMGVEVEKKDFYELNPRCGEGKVLIDDINGKYSTKKVVQYKVDDALVDVLYPADSMSHKMRVLHDAKYDGGVIKLLLTDIGMPDAGSDWLIPLAHYGKVNFDVPGKMQSPEIFVYFSGRTDKCSAGYLRTLHTKWNGFVVRKSATMILTDAYMNAGTVFNKVSIRAQMYDETLLRSILPSQLSQSPLEHIYGMTLCSMPRHCTLRSASGRFLYDGYKPVGQMIVKRNSEEGTPFGTFELL